MKKDLLHSAIINNKYIPSAEFYSQILDSLQDYAIFTINSELIINSWSSGSTKLFGYETEDVIGKPCEIIFTQEDRKNNITQKKIDTALKEGRVADSRWHVRRDGSLFYAYGVFFPLMGTDGELLGFVKILHDLTKSKKSEEAIQKYIKDLEELNSHKEKILAILSHDLRSPLAAIIQLSETLRDDFETMGHDELKTMLVLQYEAATNELKMLDRLLEWAKIKYASELFTPSQIELVKYVYKVFDTLKEAADLKTIKLHNEIEANTSVFADEKMLLSILQNIVSNAIKHSHTGGQIIASATIKDDKMVVQIKDNGAGISKEIQEKLFTPQMNALSNKINVNGGAGIGLLLVKELLNKNGGEIWFESIEGKGTTFYFTLHLKKPLDEIVNN